MRNQYEEVLNYQNCSNVMLEKMKKTSIAIVEKLESNLFRK